MHVCCQTCREKRYRNWFIGNHSDSNWTNLPVFIIFQAGMPAKIELSGAIKYLKLDIMFLVNLITYRKIWSSLQWPKTFCVSLFNYCMHLASNTYSPFCSLHTFLSHLNFYDLSHTSDRVIQNEKHRWSFWR